MRADYDSRAGTIQIELASVDRLDRDDVEIEGVVVGLLDGQATMVDVLDVRAGFESRLRDAADRHDLDAEALAAAARAALAAPDRTVTLDVAVRATA